MAVRVELKWTSHSVTALADRDQRVIGSPDRCLSHRHLRPPVRRIRRSCHLETIEADMQSVPRPKLRSPANENWPIPLFGKSSKKATDFASIAKARCGRVGGLR